MESTQASCRQGQTEGVSEYSQYQKEKLDLRKLSMGVRSGGYHLIVSDDFVGQGIGTCSSEFWDV